MRVRASVFLIVATTACASPAASGSGTAADGTPPSPAEGVVAPAPLGDAGVRAEAGPSACGDTKLDAKNCGSCGHDCLGGACNDGACQPVVLASNAGHPWPIAVAGGWVYWASYWPGSDDAGAVVRCPVGGGAAEVVADGERPTAIAVDGPDVYVFSSGTPWRLLKCPVTGCTGAESPLAVGATTEEGFSRGIAVDGTTVYWVDAKSRSVHACAKSGCGGAPSMIAKPGAFAAPNGLVVASGGVFFTTGSGGTNAAVLACPTSGCPGAPSVFAPAQSLPSAITTDGSRVFWIDGDANGRVLACTTPSCGGPPAVLTSQRIDPTAIAADGDAIFWTEGAGGKVACVSGKCGPTARTLATLPALRGIAVDVSSVYFTSPDTGRVFRLAK